MSTHQPRNGLASDPRILAGAAAGLVSALAALWAFRGLPLGMVMFWVTPLPLFLAGLGFGRHSFVIALATAVLALWLGSPGTASLAIYLGAYALPAGLLLATAMRGLAQGGGVVLGPPLVVLGLWPAGMLLLTAMLLSGPEGGLEQWLREAVSAALASMGVEEQRDALVTQIIRLQAALVALWLAIVLTVNAAVAQRLLRRAGLALVPMPRWSTARLPRWYPALPALAALGWLLSGAENALLLLSLCLVLGVPLFLQGLAVLHTRLRPAKARLPLLVLIYVLLLVFSLPGALILVALGLVDQFGRAPPANT